MERFRRVQQKVALLVLLSITSGPATVLAQDRSKFFQLRPLPARLLPEYITCIYQNVRYACFDAPQMVELNTLEVQARYWHSQWEDYTGLLAVKDAELKSVRDQLELHLDMSRLDQDHIHGLNEQLTSEIEAKNEWRSKALNPPTWPLWVGGTIGVLGLGALLGSLID